MASRSGASVKSVVFIVAFIVFTFTCAGYSFYAFLIGIEWEIFLFVSFVAWAFWGIKQLMDEINGS
jgi:hypothetical protein